MRLELVKQMPAEAFSRGLGKLTHRHKTKGVLILGFDTEFDAGTQEVFSYQLSDGVCSTCESVVCQSPTDPSHVAKNTELIPAARDLSWRELADWVQSCMSKWGYSRRDWSQLLLVSHFSTAELSHIDNFWEESQVRRVSAAQVYNATYHINKRQRLVVMDNYHFWNVGNNGNASLFAVAEKFGEQKVELPEDLPIDKASRAYLEDDRFIHYAMWDAVLCARVFHKFRERLWNDFQIDVVQYPTSASLAMAVYRRHFLPESLPAPDAKVRRQAWESLWGGRAEAYRQGDFDGEHTLRDVVSLYPSSERILEILPTAVDWVERNEPQSWRGLCRVRFKFPDSVRYPCLPICHDAKLIFPREGVSNCTLDEARVALHLGAEMSFLSVWEYDTGDRSLTDFMTHFARLKAEHEEKGVYDSKGWQPCTHAKKCACEMKDAVGRELDKLMMNSLIGKLSQNKGDVDIEDMKTFAKKIDVPLKVCISPTFLHPDKPRSKFRIGGHIMPEWSALILGKARSIMAALLNEVGESLICSTDSLLVPDHLNALVDTAMEKQKVVLTSKNRGMKTHRVRVVRNRVYSACTKEGEIVFGASHAIHIGSRKKGCRACLLNTCKEPTHNALRFILTDEKEYRKTKRLGLKTAIRSGERFFSESEAPMTFSRAWDNKRLLLANGDSRPWQNVQEYNAVCNKLKARIDTDAET